MQFLMLVCAGSDFDPPAVELVRGHPMASAGRIELRAVWDNVPGHHG